MNETDTIDVGDAIVAGVVSHFTRCPDYLYEDKTLDMADMFTYGILLRFAGAGKKTGLGAIPSIGKMAELSRASESSVKRRLAKLKDRGWVTVRRRGLTTSNQYKVYGPHPECPSVGAKVEAETLREELAARKNDPSVEVNLTHQERSKTPLQDGSKRSTNRYTSLDKDSNPPKVPQGTDGDGFSFDDEENAPVPLNHKRPRGETRHVSEADHPYWSGDEGEKQRKRFMTLWKRHPRQEARDRAMRAWRIHAGDDARHQFAMAIIFKTHGRKCLEWQSFTPGMQPTLERWLKQRDWLNDERWPVIAEEIARGEFRASDDPDVLAFLREPIPEPQIPNRRPPSQADLNSASRGKFVE
jgi:hypothetical protein